ncbi:MAG TPA: OmpA family protein [Gemmatimonadaceae bacterium]|jgi:outer membrane protein OmpA-like peptidoglycan-associated protein|nr:OmpA family protein [Gemmatimonadaceae bacterium]
MPHNHWRAFVAALAVLVAAACMQPESANAQGLFKKIKKKAKETTEQRIVDRAGQATDKVLDKTEGVIVCVATDVACIQDAQKQGKEVSVTDASGNAVTGADSAAAIAAANGGASASAGGAPANLKPGEGAWANYDFVPGDRPIFLEDFSKDNVGDFPKRFEFRMGNMEIVEWQGQRWLRSGGHDVFGIILPETLPDRFTMEFDLSGGGNGMEINFANEDPSSGPHLSINAQTAFLIADPIRGQGELQANTNEKPTKIRISVDGKYLKLYANEHRALNVPNANLGRSNHIYINMNGWSADDPRLIANIRIFAGGKDLYDALAEKGRVATQGIFFATGSAELAGESTPTLKEIGQMLKDHADLSLTIEGHTDNTGSPEANQTLSEKRAAAVKAYLVSTFGIAESRLEAKGFGASKPAASNDTPEGRQQNRRVELVKR